MEEASVTKVLDGRVAMVTGAGRGLGLEIAKGLAMEGAIVLVNGRNREQLARAVDEITAAGGTACAAPFDVTDDEAVTSAIADAVRAHGQRWHTRPPELVRVHARGCAPARECEPHRAVSYRA